MAKEAKYEHGLKKNDYDTYDDLLNTIKENNNASSRLENSRPCKYLMKNQKYNNGVISTYLTMKLKNLAYYMHSHTTI